MKAPFLNGPGGSSGPMSVGSPVVEYLRASIAQERLCSLYKGSCMLTGDGADRRSVGSITVFRPGMWAAEQKPKAAAAQSRALLM
jgi:hypothetical protein